MKTSELTGAALDWAVMHCEHPNNTLQFFFKLRALHALHSSFYYSTNWAQGGPIIEREKIAVQSPNDKGWYARDYAFKTHTSGSTPLIAAMRCYVASKLGNTIEIPKEIAK